MMYLRSRRAAVLLLAWSLQFPGAARALEAADLFDKMAASVWQVQTEDALGRRLGSGSAVVIGPGRLVTNCHVLARSQAFVVRKDNVSYSAMLEFPDPERDLCQIRVANFSAPAVELADMNSLRVGAKVYAIGNPRGLEATLSDGLISGLRRATGGGLEMVQTTAPMSPGSSGGGLFDTEGRLIGITTSGLRDSQNINFAIPSPWITELPQRGGAALAARNVASSAVAGGGAKPADPPLAATAAASGPLRTGDIFDYGLTDRTTRRTQTILYRVEQANAKRVIFQSGIRVETPSGDLLELNGMPLGEIDLVTPPGGWVTDGSIMTGSRQLRFSNRRPGYLVEFRLNAIAAPVAELTVEAGTFQAVRIDLSGWTERSAGALEPLTAPYRATLWLDSVSRQVLRFGVQARSVGGRGHSYIVDDALELRRIIRN